MTTRNCRNPSLQRFLDSMRDALDGAINALDRAEQEAARHCHDNIFGALRTTGSAPAIEPVQRDACSWLEPALATARQGSTAAAQHAICLRDLAPSLRWVARRGASQIGEPFASGHANATVVGNGGLEQREDLWIGISLVAPQVNYPDHRHPPEELYLVLSPGYWRQQQNAWHEPGVGAAVYNRPGIMHAMRADQAPLLATWCLWIGP